MRTVIEHPGDHDVYAHQLTDEDRHNAAEFIAATLVPKLVAGWAVAPDYELVYEVRRLHAQPASELNTMLLNLVTDEQARRWLAARDAVTS